jgi:hypothetical protein
VLNISVGPQHRRNDPYNIVLLPPSKRQLVTFFGSARSQKMTLLSQKVTQLCFSVHSADGMTVDFSPLQISEEQFAKGK